MVLSRSGILRSLKLPCTRVVGHLVAFRLSHEVLPWISNSEPLFIIELDYAVFPLAACLLFSACSSLPKGELPLDLGIKDRGIASWYGKEFHGKLAANGEVFDMMAYTAAHRKLPLGSIVQCH